MGVFRKRGGGILHGKTGTITGLEFEQKQWDGKKGKDDYFTISAVLTVKEDGQEDETKAFVQAGFIHPGDDEDNPTEGIDSDNPAILTSESGEGFIGDDTDFAKLLNSMFELNADLEEPIAESNGLDFSSIVGLRCKFERKIDEEANEKFGKRKVKAKKGPNKGKEMEFNRDYLIVTDVLGREGKGDKKAAKKATSSKKKDEDAEEESGEDTLADDTKAMLLSLLKKNGGKISKSNLNLLVMKYAVEKDLDGEIRDSMRKLVSSTDFLEQEDGWKFDGKVVTGKK